MNQHVSTLTAAVIVTALSMNVGFASPPSGQITFEEYGRAQVAEAATVSTPHGTDVVLGSYTVAPGAHSGWRTTASTSVLAVTSGRLAVHDAAGCTPSEYPVGHAAVLPPGRYLVHNGGTEPVQLAVAFPGLPAGDPKPFAEGPGEAAPAGCDGITGYVAGEEPAGVAAVKSYRGTLTPLEAYGASRHAAHSGSIEAKAGTDVLGTIYRSEPGFSSGWIKHAPAIQLVTKGAIVYYEERDGRCVEAGRWSAGQANVHNSPHPHMAVVEGTETLEYVLFFFNLPAGSPKPLLGSQGEAIDSTPLPPAGCPRLR